MKKISIVSFFLFGLLTACISVSPDGISFNSSNEGKGPIIAKTYDQFKFCGIEQENGIESEVYKSPVNKVIVNAPDDIIDNIIVEMKDSKSVYIHVKKNAHISTRKVKVQIYTTTLCILDASSASGIAVKDSFTQDEIFLESSSGASIKGQFSALKMNIKSSSGSQIDASIKAKEVVIKSSSGSSVDVNGYSKTSLLGVSSGAHIDAENLISMESNLESSSGGSISVSITQKADAKASSGSSIDIYKKGDHISINKQETSGGNVSIQ